VYDRVVIDIQVSVRDCWAEAVATANGKSELMMRVPGTIGIDFATIFSGLLARANSDYLRQAQPERKAKDEARQTA
jgi:hypothetical protein